jgi:hypothetical protein
LSITRVILDLGKLEFWSPVMLIGGRLEKKLLQLRFQYPDLVMGKMLEISHVESNLLVEKNGAILGPIDLPWIDSRMFFDSFPVGSEAECPAGRGGTAMDQESLSHLIQKARWLVNLLLFHGQNCPLDHEHLPDLDETRQDGGV